MSKRTLYLLIGLVLIVVLLAAAWVAGWQITGEKNPLEWTKPKDEEQTNTAFIGNVQDSEYSTDNKLMRLSKSAVTRSVNDSGDEIVSYTLSVIVTPAESEVTSFAWSADFENAQSEWASGKNTADYVTITPAADNRSAEVTCLQAFGEPIVVMCAYTENSTLSATCKFDYVKRIVGGGASLFNVSSFNNGEGSAGVEYIYGEGTVKGTAVLVSAWGELSDEAYNYMLANTYYSRWLTSGGSEFKKASYVCENGDGDWFSLSTGDFVGKNNTGANWNCLEAAFKLLAQNTTNQLRIGVQVTYNYGDSYSETLTVYGDYLSLLPGSFETNILTVTGVQMEQTNGVF